MEAIVQEGSRCSTVVTLGFSEGSADSGQSARGCLSSVRQGQLVRVLYNPRFPTEVREAGARAIAGQVLALAILYIDQRLPSDGSIRISHHVHDELCLVATDAKVAEAALLLRDGLVHGFLTVFPGATTRGLVQIGAGRTWKEAGSDTSRIPEASL